MKKHIKGFLSLFFAGVMGLSVACGSTNNQTGGTSDAPSGTTSIPKEEYEITVKSTYNTTIVKQVENIDNLNEGKFVVSAAKGETDSAQIIIKPTGRIDEYDFKLSDLSDGKGNVLSKENMTLCTQMYTRVVNGSIDFPAGYYPDALIPIEYVKGLKENFVEANKNQGFWLDIKVPEDAVAGEYTGTATFIYDGKEEEIEISLTVYDFVMPKTPALDITYLIWPQWIINGELDSTVDMWKTYFDFLLEYNICGRDLPVELGDIEGFKAAVREYYGQLYTYYVPYKILGTNWNDYTIDGDLMKEYYLAIAEISVEDGINYFDKARLYTDTITDECTHGTFAETKYPATLRLLPKLEQIKKDTVNELIAKGIIENDTCEMAQSILGIQQVMVTEYHQPFVDLGDKLFCPGYGWFDTTDELNAMQKHLEEGIEFYSYGAMTKGLTGAALINDNTISGRDVFWSKFEYDMTGDLFWNVTGYCAWWQLNVAGGYGILNDLYTQASHDGLTNGDGYMMYPGAGYNSDKPFASIRLAQRREGADDYAYLTMLEEEYEKLSQEYGFTADIDSSLDAVYEEIYSLGLSKLNHQGLVDMREYIANLLELSKGEAGFVLNKLDLGKEAVNVEMFLKKGYQVQVNGKTYSGVVSGNGQKVSVTLPYGDVNIKVLKEGYAKEVTFKTGVAPEKIYNFTSQDEINNIIYALNGTSFAQLDTTNTLSGNSVKVTLGGYAAYETHRPYAYFAIDGVTDLSYVEFSVYNPQTKDVTVEVVAKNQSLDLEYGMDIITLKAGEWTKIRVGAFYLIGYTEEKLGQVSHIGIKCVDNIVNNGKDGQISLYVDEFYTKEKTER